VAAIRLVVILPYSFVQWAGRNSLWAKGFRLRRLPVGDGGQSIVVYECAGHGWAPPALLIHGLGSAATSFLPLAARLLPFVRRVLLVDLPGHGLAAAAPGQPVASKEDLVAGLELVLRELAEPALLVGNSLGGALAFSAAIGAPELTHGVIALSPAGAPLVGAERDDLLHAFRGGTEGALELGHRMFHEKPVTYWFVARGLGRHLAEPQIQHLLASIPERGGLLSPEELARLDRPSLVLWGEADRVLPKSGLTFFQDHLPPGSVDTLPGCGHLPQIERPSEVAEQVHAFLARIARCGPVRALAPPNRPDPLETVGESTRQTAAG
jgi:pimeloyl-ACP methyl ester carboxylesterase